MLNGLVICGVILAGSAAQMTIQELETKLRDGCDEILAGFKRSPEAFPQLAAKCDALLPFAEDLLKRTAAEVSRRVPGIAAMVAERSGARRVAVFRKAPVVLYGKATEEQVIALWKGQLGASIAAASGLMHYDQAIVKEWMMAWVEGKSDRRAFFRAEQVRDCLMETRKLCALLSTPREIVRVDKGKALFEDAFSGDLSNWHTFGEGTIEVGDGQLHAKGAGITIWCRHEFPNALVSLDYKPAASAGAGAGALFAFPGTPVKGKDYSASSGPMVNYNYGIVTYHCSLYRGQTGRTNLRRTGSGLRMLSTVMPDPCAQLGRTYRLEFLKRDATMQVYVDGKLVHSYVDAGVYGSPPAKGRFGVRHFSAQELESFYDNFSACSLRDVK